MEDWALGRTKILLKFQHTSQLEARAASVLLHVATIQRCKSGRKDPMEAKKLAAPPRRVKSGWSGHKLLVLLLYTVCGGLCYCANERGSWPQVAAAVLLFYAICCGLDLCAHEGRVKSGPGRSAVVLYHVFESKSSSCEVTTVDFTRLRTQRRKHMVCVAGSRMCFRRRVRSRIESICCAAVKPPNKGPFCRIIERLSSRSRKVGIQDL